MYFKKKAKFFIYHYYFKQKNNKKFDAAIFFPFQWYFECWPIYLPSLPMHLLLLCINLGLTKKKYTNTTYNTYLYLETVYSIDKQQTKI